MNLKEKYELVCQVLSGQSLRVVSIVAGINSGQLYQWVHKYKTLGYNGLINKPKGRPSKDCKMKVTKTISPRKLKESEYENPENKMDAPCKIQGSIHVFRLVNNMCPGKWVHIKYQMHFLNLRLTTHSITLIPLLLTFLFF